MSEEQDKQLETTEETQPVQTAEVEAPQPPEPEIPQQSENVEEAPQEPQEPESTVEETPLDPKTVDKAQAETLLKDKGFDYSVLQKEFNETGDISQETRTKLNEAGISDEMINDYKEGQKALVEKELDEISQCVGGRENLTEVINWAANNISDDEKTSIAGITDKNVMMIVLKDLKNRMEEKEGKIPENQINGDGIKTTTEIYESQAQMLEAIKDPRYKNDEVYRAKVMEKIHASREAGIDLGI